MNSSRDTWCSHQGGSPIRISPDHRLCASPRSFSQLTTSFIAFLRLGIPTHALSSLTIKLISNTEVVSGQWPAVSRTDPRHLPTTTRLRSPAVYSLHGRTCNLCSCPSIFSFQRTLSGCAHWSVFRLPADHWPLATDHFVLVGLGRLELPTSPLSGVRSSHLSYRPASVSAVLLELVELIGIEPTTS